jgi:hypothetical protein
MALFGPAMFTGLLFVGGRAQGEEPSAVSDKVQKLIKQLGDTNFDKREEATETLIEIGTPAVPILRNALKRGQQEEVRARIKRVLSTQIVERDDRPATLVKLQEMMKEAIQISPAEAKVFEDPKTTIRDALDFIATRYKFSYEVNEKAFEKAGSKADDKLMEYLSGEKGPFPLLNDVPLGTILQKIVDRMGKGDDVAAWLIRRDHIEVTTEAALREEFYPRDYKGPLFPLVYADIQKEYLEDALNELADHSGYNIILDSHAGKDAGKTIVSARVSDAPLITVVRILANMSDLKFVQMGNILYVTSPQHAKALQAERKAKPK